MRRALALAAATAGWLVAAASPAALSVTIRDIGPSRSTLHASDPDGASGGRVNGIGIDRDSPGTLYAASEWGGLWKSTDNGRSWAHLDGHVPTATWDVEVDPDDSNRVYATSFYDGRVASRAGINVSTDGGASWSHPPTATPPVGFCDAETRRDELAAFGIAVDPNDPDHVFAGTNCGVAISIDRGATWTFVDPTPADGANDVWDVVVHHGGVIDVCGDDGHRRSTTGGASWTTATGTPLPSGTCSLAVSPDEPWVLYTVVGTSIFESDDGGDSWPVTYTNPDPLPQGRIPFVATNQRSGATYDLWFGDVSLYRGTCKTPSPAAPGGSARCNASTSWAGPFTRDRGAHDDVGDIAFVPNVASDACPLLFSSDGGVFFNTLGSSPGCHTPAWEQPNVTPHALWNFDFAGVSRPGGAAEDLYMGNQDNGTFGTGNGGAAAPNWTNENCCDGFDVAGDPARVLNTVCCFNFGPATRLFISSPGMSGPTAEISTPPPGLLRGFEQLDSIVSFGPDDYAVATSEGVFVTTDVTASPIVWTEIGATSTPAEACGIQVAFAGTSPVFFVKSFGCSGDRPGTLWRYQGTAPGGTWQQVPNPGKAGFGIFAVDRNDPQRIIASRLSTRDPAMVLTQNGGINWNSLAALDALMTGSGVFRSQNLTGPTAFTSFSGYPQPTLVAFDPTDRDLVVAGGADSGVFLSTNGGTRWELVTDPVTPGTSGTPHIPRPRYAHFDHDAPGGEVNLYLGTQGRSVWRLTFAKVLTPEIQVPEVHLEDTCLGGDSTAALKVCNTSPGELVVDAITSSNPEVTVAPPSAGYPVRISHDFCFPFAVRFAPAAAGPRGGTLTISSNDPSYPALELEVEAAGTEPDVRVSGSLDFGVGSAWNPTEKTVSVCNTGKCDLEVASAAIDCPDFTLLPDPLLPATVSHDFCLDLVVTFTPTRPGRHRCELTIATNDADTPSVKRELTGRTPAFFSLHAGLADPHGVLGGIAKQGSTFNLDFLYPVRPRLAWELRLGVARFDGRAGNPDTDVWILTPDVRYTVNPTAPIRVFASGGVGAYHFDPGAFEAGANLGLGVGVPAGARFTIEATYTYHWVFTASPTLRFSQVQAGVLISF